MESFSYEATTGDGSIVTGIIEAANERLAIDQLQEKGYFPLKVGRARERKPILSEFLSSAQSRVKERDIMGFTYQLGVLLEAGFPLDRSLTILSELADKKPVKDLIAGIHSQIRSGKSFSEALSKYPSSFPLFYVNMIKSGEAGGFLEDTISRMAVYLENSQALKEEVRSALLYPAFLVIAGGGAVLFLLTFVVPKFTKIFSDMGGELPFVTDILISISGALVNYWWVILLLFAGSAVFLRRYLKSEDGRRAWDKIKFKLPLFGKLFRETIVSRFSRTMGTLLAGGVPILNALKIVQGTLDSDRMAAIIASVRDEVRKGRGISEPLRASDIFPPIAVHMVTVGEETGRLDEMLIKTAERFDIEVRTTVKRLLSLLAPSLIMFMGLIIGFIVIAMLIAMLSINELPF